MRVARGSSVLCLVTFVLVGALAFPPDLWAFMDEDTLKISGIALGATLGVCLVVVLIAGTMKDLGGEEEEDDFLARLPLPEGAVEQGMSLLNGTAFRRKPGCSPALSGASSLSLPLLPHPDSGDVRGNAAPPRFPGYPDFGLKTEAIPGYAGLDDKPFPVLPAKGPVCPERAGIPRS